MDIKMNEKWFALDVPQIEKKLKTNAALGLSRKAARSRVSPKNGELFYPKVRSPLRMLGEILADFALLLLLLTATVSLFFEEIQNGIVVLVLALIHVTASYLLYYRAQKFMERLGRHFRPLARVIRGGKLCYCDYRQVVIGDVLLLERGDVICADARLTSSDSLKVNMRTGRNEYVMLEKQAQGHVRSGENDVRNMVTMVHAGSVIEEGSARAIVTAVGKYTYLGALTGGIVEEWGESAPKNLVQLRKSCSHMSLISLLCVFPFCLVSLLLSYMNHGEVLLSYAFLTALSVAACSMTQAVLTVFKIFYVWQIYHLSRGANYAIPRSTAAFDCLSEVDYLFLLDGSTLTDGMIHFYAADGIEGRIRNYSSLSAVGKRLGEMAAVYDAAQSRALSSGGSGHDKLSVGLHQFIKNCGVDSEAMKIRYPIQTYSPGNRAQLSDRVFFNDHGQKKILSVSYMPDILEKCSEAWLSGGRQCLSPEGIDRLRKVWNAYAADGCQTVIFTLSDSIGANECFLGMLAFREGIDAAFSGKIARLRKMGVRTVLFEGSRRDAPEIPAWSMGKSKISKNDLLKNRLPLDYRFGEYEQYSGFDENDILELVRLVHKQNRKVAIVGFSEYAAEAISEADLFITCSALTDGTTMWGAGVRGEAVGSSCLQNVKYESQTLIPRPAGGKGGLGSLGRAIVASRTARRNISMFFCYMISVQWARILCAGIPMLFGSVALDARHILFFGFFMDLIALWFFASNREPEGPEKNPDSGFRLKPFIAEHKHLLLSITVASGVMILLPRLLGLLVPFLYKIEYAFVSMFWLQLTMLYFLRYHGRVSFRDFYKKEKSAIFSVAAVLILVALFFLIRPFGYLFEIQQNPLVYFLLTFVPAATFAGMLLFGMSRKK